MRRRRAQRVISDPSRDTTSYRWDDTAGRPRPSPRPTRGCSRRARRGRPWRQAIPSARASIDCVLIVTPRTLRSGGCRVMPWENRQSSTTERADEPPDLSLDRFDWRVSRSRSFAARGEDVDRVLEHGTAVEIGVNDDVRDVAVNEHLARWQSDDLVGGNGRAADPQLLGRLACGELGEERRILGDRAGRPGAVRSKRSERSAWGQASPGHGPCDGAGQARRTVRRRSHRSSVRSCVGSAAHPPHRRNPRGGLLRVRFL